MQEWSVQFMFKAIIFKLLCVALKSTTPDFANAQIRGIENDARDFFIQSSFNIENKN